jgi:hypothetical protein
METQSSTHKNIEEIHQKSRKKYEKPAVIYQAPLEAMASLCIGVPPLQPGKASIGPCDINYITS